MTNDDRRRLVATLTGVYGFYGADLTEFALGVWLDVAAEFDVPVFEAALNRHVRDPEGGRWLPKPADVIRQLRGNSGDAALLAWGEVMSVAKAGGWGYEKLPQASRSAVADMGGMSAIQRSQESENGFMQRRFVETFMAYKRREESPPLAVEHEQQARLQ